MSQLEQALPDEGTLSTGEARLWITCAESTIERPFTLRKVVVTRRFADHSYFHWVATANPPAMKPKPTNRFQLWIASMGKLPPVT